MSKLAFTSIQVIPPKQGAPHRKGRQWMKTTVKHINYTMKAKKILFINQEITPYVPSSELSEMGKNLSLAIQENGVEIRTFMPKWGTINERRGQLHEVQRLSGMNLIIDDTDHPLIIKVASIPTSRLQVYFIDNEDYFQKRRMETDEQGEEYTDNGQRAIFFARGVLETVKKLRWVPDVIVCQGWMSAVVPVYIKKAYNDEPSFANTKVVSTIFSGNLSNDFGKQFKDCIAFKSVTEETMAKYADDFNLLELGKLAVDYSDAVTVVGEDIIPELLNYIDASGLPVMKHNADATLGEIYPDFIDSIIDSTEE